jgi:acetyl-CoA acetyltransferase
VRKQIRNSVGTVTHLEPIVVAGVGMTTFTKVGRSVRDTAQEAVALALADAGARAEQVQFVAFANAVGGLITGQEMIRGHAALRYTGLLGATLVNVEAACASGAAAVELCASAIRAGSADIAVAVGAERLTAADPLTSLAAIGTALDLEQLDLLRNDEESHRQSAFVYIYAALGLDYMKRTGATCEDFASVVVKNRQHAGGNPYAQFRSTTTINEVLNSRSVAYPLTSRMCSTIGDGAAAVVLASVDAARRLGLAHSALLQSIVVLSGRDDATGPTVVERASARAFELASIGPSEVDVAEVHDGAAPGELISIEQLGLTDAGGALRWLRDGTSALGGRCPVNPSGGLISRGHPIGATGVAQIVELALQLSGRATGRQVEGARVAVAENAGGWIGNDSAAGAVTVLTT